MRPFFGFVPGPSYLKIASFLWIFPSISSIFRQNRQVLLDFANIANFEAQNRGNLAIGDTSPAQIFHRQRVAQNRGFGEKSPEMLTLHLDQKMCRSMICEPLFLFSKTA